MAAETRNTGPTQDFLKGGGVVSCRLNHGRILSAAMLHEQDGAAKVAIKKVWKG